VPPITTNCHLRALQRGQQRLASNVRPLRVSHASIKGFSEPLHTPPESGSLSRAVGRCLVHLYATKTLVYCRVSVYAIPEQIGPMP